MFISVTVMEMPRVHRGGKGLVACSSELLAVVSGTPAASHLERGHVVLMLAPAFLPLCVFRAFCLGNDAAHNGEGPSYFN